MTIVTLHVLNAARHGSDLARYISPFCNGHMKHEAIAFGKRARCLVVIPEQDMPKFTRKKSVRQQSQICLD